MILKFGRYKGQKLEEVDESYLQWLINPEGKTRPIDENLVNAARLVLEDKLAKARDEKFSERCLAGNETGFEDPIYVIKAEGDVYSLSGRAVIDGKWFTSLEGALEHLSSEYPFEEEILEDGTTFRKRSTPDPEDDKIEIYEVLPSGHSKPVWGFYGWHYSTENSPVGQCSLPGDSEDLYTLAVRDY